MDELNKADVWPNESFSGGGCAEGAKCPAVPVSEAHLYQSRLTIIKKIMTGEIQ
jgi:hypothetical protein